MRQLQMQLNWQKQKAKADAFAQAAYAEKQALQSAEQEMSQIQELLKKASGDEAVQLMEQLQAAEAQCLALEQECADLRLHAPVQSTQNQHTLDLAADPDLQARLNELETECDNLKFELEAANSEKEQWLKDQNEEEVVVEQFADVGAQCRSLEKQIVRMKREAKSKLKKQQWAQAERIFKGIKDSQGNPLKHAFSAWDKERLDSKRAAKARSVSIRLLSSVLVRMDKQLLSVVTSRMLRLFRQSKQKQEVDHTHRNHGVALMAKIQIRHSKEQMQAILTRWWGNWSSGIKEAISKHSGLRSISSILKKWEHELSMRLLSKWSSHVSKTRTASTGLRLISQITDKWTKGALKGVVLKWRANLKVSNEEQRSKQKRHKAKGKMEADTNDVKARVMKMIADNEAKAKKEKGKLQNEINKLQAENARLLGKVPQGA